MKKLLHTIFHAIFWVWNFTFLMVVYLGIVPLIAPPLFSATLAGQVPIEFSLTVVALVGIPTISTIVGANRFRSEPLQLIRLFYGVEAPLFLLCLLRLFVLRELTPASTHILVSLSVCILAFLAELLYGYLGRHRTLAWVQMVLHSLMLLVGVYAGTLLLFYAVPTAAAVVQAFFTFRWVDILWSAFRTEFFATVFWWIPLFLILFGLTCSLFVAMPLAMTIMYVYSGQRVLRAFAADYGLKRALAGVSAVAIASFTLFISFQQQPQIPAFSLLERLPSTDNARQALLAKSDTIRTGLVNAYLSNYRYLSTEKDNDHIKVMYKTTFTMPDSVSQGLQNTYNRLMSPFLYNGSASDIDKAEKLYEQFFDTPLQKAEAKAVNHALQSTYNRDEAKAGLLDLHEQKVWLRSQQITVQEHEDWADVELYEVYVNQTFDLQEVFYSFSLPESAVITGIWLGDTDERNKRFPFVVSPRGAAQKVYNQQVRERVDPALLEQVGPRHYRLRAFPIPSRVSEWQETGPTPTEMHMWLTYKVMRQEKGWAMPQLGEKRNLFWTKDTKRIRNGKVSGKELDAWVEAFLPASNSYQPSLHQASLQGDYQITVKPLSAKDYLLPKNQRFAIVLDSSLSMAKRVKELSQTFTWLKQQGFANNTFTDNDADLYITTAVGATPQRLDDINQFNPAKLTFYGSVQLKEMLQQFVQLRGDTPYDGILLVTDEGSYELSDDSKNLPTMPAPLWMVHLGALPPAYDDTTLKAIETSGGGVAMEIPEVLRRLATKTALGSSAVSVVDGYAWLMEKVENNLTPSVQTEKSSEAASFDAVAARQLVLGLSREKDLNKLVQLDAIHAIAKTFKIVTPYSSMIVLVNDQQRQALKEAEAQKDRFDRKVESGKEQLTKPFNPLNTSASVPEPSAALAVGAFAIAVLFFTKQGRRRVNWK